MTDPNTAGTGYDELQRSADQAREALAAQREVSGNLVQEQQQVRDTLTKQALQAQHDRYQEWLSAKAQGQNQLMPASNELPPAPREPLATTGTPEQIQAGKQALDAYKTAGFIAHRDNAPVSGGAQATAADHALTQERAFRERQQQLADKITDPKASPEQRERLELQKTTEYHNHHSESWNQVAELQRQLGYPDKSIGEAQKHADHHKEQAALVANQLHQHDQKNGMVPREVQLGLEKENHNTAQGQIQQRDPHLDALAAVKIGQESHTQLDPAKEQPQKAEQGQSANPALDRAMQRREAAAQRHNGTEPSAWLKEQVAEANTRESQIEAVREQQRTEALGHKAELEQRAAHAR